MGRKQRLMQRGSWCRRAGTIESTKKSGQSNLLVGINTNERKTGTRNSQQTINTIYTRGGCHLQGNLVNADGVFPRMELGNRIVETSCGLERGSWSGGVDHRIVRKHDGTDIDPKTSDRHHRSKIDNTEWGRRDAWVGCSMRLRYNNNNIYYLYCAFSKKYSKAHHNNN